MGAVNRYRPEIDGLRAFAVVSVIINHLNKDILPGGYLGVDIFFVISGYVITSSLSGRSSAGFKDFIGGFYARRISRLVPALLAFVLIASTVICFFNPEPQDSLQTGFAALFGFSNLNLLAQATDYFAYSTEFNVFTHTWSLGVEEQFYVLFPLLVWFSGFGRQSKKGARNLFLILSFLSILSMMTFIYLYSYDQSAAYFLMPSRFWEMAVGGLIFIAFNKSPSFAKHLEKLPPLFVLAFIVIVMFLPIDFAVLATILMVFLTILLIASLKGNTAVYKIFTHPKVVYIGLISYSLYLWHWGVLSISKWTVGIHWWSVPFQLVLMFVAAMASYHWIETPFRKNRWSIGRSFSILLGVSALVIGSILIFLLENLYSSYLFLRSVSARDLQAKSQESYFSIGYPCIAHDDMNSSDVDQIFENCKSPALREFPLQVTVAFIGDSHALNLLKGSNAFEAGNFRYIGYFYAGCPFPYPVYGYKDLRCSGFLQQAQRSVLNDLKRGDYIVIFNYHLSHLGDESFGEVRHNLFDQRKNVPRTLESKFRIYSSSLERFASVASSKGITIFLVGSPHRLLGYDPRVSAQRFSNNFGSSLNIRLQEAHAKLINKKFTTFFAGASNIVFIDPIRVLGDCSSSLEKFASCYIDSDHLSLSSAYKINQHIYGLMQGRKNSL